MTAQPFMASAPLGSTASMPKPTSPDPAVLASMHAPDQSLLSRLWQAYRQHRNAARIRNLAVDIEPRLLEDVGAPPWLINESIVRRQLERLRNADYIRW